MKPVLYDLVYCFNTVSNCFTHYNCFLKSCVSQSSINQFLTCGTPLHSYHTQSKFELILVRRLSIKIGGKNENWLKGAFSDGEVKLIGSHAKIDVKTVPRGIFVFAPYVCL